VNINVAGFPRVISVVTDMGYLLQQILK